MILDDTVCRGSLIIQNEVRYVVLGLMTTPKGVMFGASTEWKVIPVEDLKAGRGAGFSRFLEHEEVDFFFGGVVWPLPDYI